MTMYAPFRSQATAYGRIQVETGVTTADPHKLVAMLFEGAVSAITEARGALQRGDVEAKGRAIGRAVRIVEEGLRAALNHKDGGELARNLDSLYVYVTGRLTHANLRNDEAAMKECQELLAGLLDAWSNMKLPHPHAA
ncbi:flagellar export chaperone FliS [Caldimonas thermodepolymerans]|uniref:flagellar export chaperone FliS n=2 Tax=Caldimonas thermodepolymerans TaxID=215580 RepID=UPI0030146DFF